MVRTAVFFWFAPPFRAAFRDLFRVPAGRSGGRALPVFVPAVQSGCVHAHAVLPIVLPAGGGSALCCRSLSFPIRLRRKGSVSGRGSFPSGCNKEARERIRSRTRSGRSSRRCARSRLSLARYRRVHAARLPAGQWSRRNAASRSSSCANCSGRFICEMQTRMPCCRLPVELSEMAQTP